MSTNAGFCLAKVPEGAKRVPWIASALDTCQGRVVAEDGLAEDTMAIDGQNNLPKGVKRLVRLWMVVIAPLQAFCESKDGFASDARVLCSRSLPKMA